PCVNRSGIRFQTERQGAAGAPALRTGLVEIRDLPLDFLETLLHEREERGPFFSVEDFLVRLEERGHGVEEAWVERLILAGGFDLLEGTRPEKLWRFRVDFKRRRRRKGAAPLADELFSGSLLQRAPVIPCLPEFDDKERARLELGLLGFTTGMLHPIELGEPERDGKRAYLPLVEAPAHVGERVSILGWLAAQRRYRTRRGDWMCFLTFEDKTGILETVLFPPAYDRFGGELSGQGRYHVRGRIEAREGALALHAESLERMGD
ncbi:MAG: OB-fold nucleic acid binding domain-containing protein, partial [Planctomycetota bacterium]